MRIFTFIMSLLVAGLTMAAPLTVVIDAGHGGHDGGAAGATSHEKDVNLAVALKLGKELKQQLGKDVKIIYTRDNDFFVTLLGRAEIANKAKADLFVSIHCNSIGNAKRRNQVSGSSVYVRGFASSARAKEVANLENAVLELEDHTKVNTSLEESLINELVWNKNLDQSIALADNILNELVSTAGRKRGNVEQNDLAVLKRTDMPAVLVEIDFICNPEMEKFMVSEKGQNIFAKAIANGIIAYHHNGKTKDKKAKIPKENVTPDSTTENEESSSSELPATKRTLNVGEPDSGNDARIDYRIQFLISPSKLAADSPLLKGVKKSECYRDGNAWKYTVGHFSTMAEAMSELKKIKSKFSDAFVVKFSKGKRIK